MKKVSSRSKRITRHADTRMHVTGVRIGCGVDVVDLSRFKQAIQQGGRNFIQRIFTPNEEAYANSRKRTTLLHLAARFAAKEASIKAISQLNPSVVPSMKEVEVRNDKLGRPHISLHSKGARGIHLHVSLSHIDTVAVASVIATK